MTQTMSLSARIATLERKASNLPQLKEVMERVAVEIQEAEEAGRTLARLETQLKASEALMGQPEVAIGQPQPVIRQADTAIRQPQPLEVEAQPVQVVHQVVEVGEPAQPAELVSEPVELAPEPAKPVSPEPAPLAEDDHKEWTPPRDAILEALTGRWFSATDVQTFTGLGRSTVQRICKQLYGEGLLDRRGLGEIGSVFEYTLKSATKPAPVLSVKEKVQQKAERISHQANLPRDLPPLPVKSKPVTPDDIDAVRKALADRPSKSASVALLAGRINRSAAHTEAVLEFMADEVRHEGNQWRLT